jgi:predicted PurR-regulated permease PerM
MLSYIQPALGSTGQMLGSAAIGAAGFFGMTAFVMLVSYFILAESGGLRENLLKIEIPGYVDDFKRLGQELGRIWNAFLRGQMIVFTLAFIFYLFVLSILGVRYAIGLALLAGISKFLPYIGPAMVWVALALVSYFQTFKLFGMDPLAYTILVIVVALIFDQFLDGIITPRIMADALSVHPAAVLVSALIFADLIGILGVIIAAPMLATFVLFGRYIMRKMLDQNPWYQKDKDKAPTPSLNILEKLRSFFKRLPFKKNSPQLDSDTVKSPPEEE